MTASVDVATSPAGGHALPPHFASTDGAAPNRRGRRIGFMLGAAGVLVAAAVGVLQVTANLGYDGARAEFDAAAASARDSATTVQQELDTLTSVIDVADLLKTADTGVLTGPSARDALTTASTDAEEAAGPAEELLTEPLPSADSKPSAFWELFAASDQLAVDAGDLDELAADLDAATPAMTAASAEVTEAGVALLRSAADAAPAFESAHLSAKNDAVIALRDAASRVPDTMLLDVTAVESLVSMQDAAGQVVATEQAELADKSGPLQGDRLEIEAFARSLAPGVLLEFDWNQIVNNAGSNGSMGGLTTWWWDDPDRAVIELSNSVAEQWPADRSKALIAHEVGHAISVKCEDMYDSSTQDSIEKWATAWAISMGFTDDANGVWAYGYPPQSYIDAAYGCR
ncbi:hypothetical protein AKG07_05830 [Microbacterium sp. CGR1]|uniref:hypothetical protein n=1 Tax=Microbacterium sp. CGR1 TaxID=1696072 RepID=UPI00069E32B5|nr:hypothetical protein [Microbacterium sp. CGR1]AKV85891.1 hypothetical protein AKG07_05830 [Microbacterium sp. CGR1]